MFRLREWFKTLLNHRAIIEKLENKVDWQDRNGMEVINLISEAKLKVRIVPCETSFFHRVELQREKTYGYFLSAYRTPMLKGVEQSIELMDEHDKKKAGKK